MEERRVDDGHCRRERGEMERFRELASEHHFPAEALTFVRMPLAKGFVFPAARLAVLADAELFGRSASMRARRLASRRERVLSGRAAMDFSEFEEGDYVVHLDHGIGRFLSCRSRRIPTRGRCWCWNTPMRRSSMCPSTKPGRWRVMWGWVKISGPLGTGRWTLGARAQEGPAVHLRLRRRHAAHSG